MAKGHRSQIKRERNAMADFNNFPMISEAYLGLYSKIPKAVSTSLPLMASSTKHALGILE